LREIRSFTAFGGYTGVVGASGNTVTSNANGGTHSAPSLYYFVTGVFSDTNPFTDETNWNDVTPSATVVGPNLISSVGPPWVLYTEFILPNANGSQQFSATSVQNFDFLEGGLNVQLIGVAS
jgi:hypothetical protein